jgi:acyl carrier protein
MSPTISTMPAIESEIMPGISELGIRTRVRAFVHENFLYAMPNFELGDDDRLLEKGVIDSMGVAEMIAFVENEFGVFTTDEEVSEANFGSLSAIARFVAGKQPYAVG